MKKTRLKRLKKFVAVVFSLILSNCFYAQNVTVAGALVGSGSYPDLNSAFTAINGGAQTGANIDITIVGNTTETVTAVLNVGAWTTLSIQPSGGAARTITGSLPAPIIDLNGADNVWINGLNTGGNALTISNTDLGNVTTTTIRLREGATSNTIANCSVLGSSSSTTLGTIFCFTSSIAGGNSSNMFSNCDIGPSAAGTPVNGIYSAGTSTALNQFNTVQNCRVYDFFNASLATAGINVASNSSNWTITGNSVYQTVARVFTSSNTHKAIVVIGGGNGHTISNNVVGYASSAGTGIYTMSGAVATRFVAIELSAASLTVSSVQGNTVSAFNFTTTNTTGTGFGSFCGINITGGAVNLGTTTGNLIGSTTGVGNIACTTGAAGAIIGINAGTTGSITVANNYVAACTNTNSTAASAASFIGINVSSGSASLSVLSNTIGNTTAHSNQAGTNLFNTGNSIFYGINITSTPTGTMNVNNNLVRNGSSFGSGTGGICRGIYISVGSTIFASSNTITALTTNNGNAGEGSGLLGTMGIYIGAGTGDILSNNEISTIANTNTLTTGVSMAGISTTGATNFRVFGNRIYDLWNTGVSTSTTAPSKCYGFFVRGSIGTFQVYNNMISLGDARPYNTAYTGIVFDGGGSIPTIFRLYYNTILIQGTSTVSAGAQSTFGFYRGGFSFFGTTCPMDIKNNIIINTRTGGTGAHYAIANAFGSTASTTGWGANACNYNVLNTSDPNAVCWWGGNQTFAGWKAISSGDGNSYSNIPVTFVNPANDLHLNMGTTPTLIESNGLVLSGYTTDYDNQNRPGPAGSVNGAGFAPDMGADEFDGVYLDQSPPAIIHAPAGGACSAGDRTLTAVITDYTGVTTGSLSPRIYYTKNGGAYLSSPGNLTSGTPNNGNWDFVINTSSLGGITATDVVSYYLIAQDATPSNYIASLPAAGLVAVDVNSVTTPPTTPYSFALAAMSGTYTIGAAGNFTSLTAAANAYNTSCLNGPVTFSLVDALYSTNETFPIIFNNNPTASSTNSLLIVPAVGSAVAISPTSTAINSVFKFLNARYITIDGVNSGGTSLTINNSNSSSTSANIWLSSTNGVGSGNNFIAVKNSTLIGGYNGGSNGVIASIDGASPSGTSGADNDNFTFTGNTLLKFYNGILAVGSASVSAGGLDNWTISNNTFGPATYGAGTDVFLGSGVVIAGATNVTIANNLIQSIYTTVGGIYGINMNSTISGFAITQNTLTNIYSNAASSGTSSIAGLFMGVGVSNGMVATNLLATIASTTTGGYGVRGITINTGLAASNIVVRNNFITDVWDIVDLSVSLYMPCGIAIEGSSGGVTVEYNSISLYGTHAGYSTGATSAADIYVGSSLGGLIIRNNILSNTYDNGSSSTDNAYAIYSAVAAGAYSIIDYNCYYAGGTGNIPAAAYQGGNVTTLSGVQSGLGQNLHSNLTQPVFTSATDLHLVPASNGALDNLGVAVAGVTVDIDNQSRNAFTPDMGADEFTSTATCSSASAGSLTTVSSTACASTSGLVLNAAGYNAANGVAYQWQVATAAGGPYTNVATGTGFTSPSYNVLLNSPGTYYFVFTETCSTFSSTSTNEHTVTLIAPPTPSIISSATHVCAGSGSSVSLTAGGTANTYLWSTGSTASSIAVTPVATTVYTLTGFPVGSYCGVTTTVSILYAPLPTLTITPAAVCPNQNVTALTASGASTYSWSTGANNSATIAPNQSVTTSYTVTGTSADGCVSAPFVKPIGILPTPTINIAGSTGICTGQTASLTASGGLSYTWDTGASVATMTAAPTSNTTYTVTGFDANGCGTSTTQLVTVAASLSISISGNSTVCASNPVTLTASGGVTYTWDAGAGSATTATVAPSPTANITYTVIGASGTCSNTATKVITVLANPTISVAGSNTNCAGSAVTLTASGASTYTWNTTATTSTLSVSPVTTSTYNVVGKDAFGCSSTSTLFTITTSTVPVISIASSATAVCVSTPATFTASGASTYTWVGGPTTADYTVTPTGAATYTVNGTNAAGCTSSKTVALGSYALPVVNIAPASATICLTNTGTFVASGAATYTWNGSATNTLATYTVVPTGNTVYTVVATTTAGCVGSKTVAVTSNSLPVMVITPPSVTVCANDFANVTASGANTYTWDVAGSQNASTAFYSPASSTHTVTGTDVNGCKASATVGVLANPLPTVVPVPSFTTVCALTPIAFSASGANTYTWTGGANGSSATLTPSASVAYSVAGTTTDGCVAGALITVVTNSLPIVSIAPATATVCSLSSTNFTASGANTYVWNGTVNTATIQVTPTVSTVYTVVGTSTANSCSSSQTVAVVANPLPTVSIAASNASICTGNSSTLTASGASTYAWNDGSTTGAVVVSPVANTNYTVTGTDNKGCVSSKTISVSVWNLPNVAVTPSVQTVCLDNTSVANYTASGASTYTWTNSSGNTSGSTYSVIPTASTFYTLTGTDANGCMNMLTFVLAVDPCTGVKENAHNSGAIRIYPNPSNGMITADFGFDGNKTIVIMNSVGALITNLTTSNQSESFDLSSLAKGVYFVKISSKQASGNYKVVVE